MAEVERIFGPVPRHRAAVNDPGGLLSVAQDQKIQRVARKIRNRFPQIFASYYLGKMPDRAHALAYGAWLQNRCRLSPGEPKLGDNFTVLLFVDPIARQASLTVGYALESILDLDTLGEILDRAEPELRRARWASAAMTAWSLLLVKLNRAWALSRKEQKS